MSNNFQISSSVVVRGNVAVHNGSIVFEIQEEDVAAFSKELYKMLKTDYSKFYKMDNLCKLAFIAAELLLKDQSLHNKYKSDEIALVFSNASASLDTDKIYFNSVEDKGNYFPSPAVFVYTLPNIMMGEICIRHKFLGENAFFVSEKFDADLLTEYTDSILSSEKAKCEVAGWVEIKEQGWEAVLFLVERSSSNESDKKRLSKENLSEIYALKKN